MMFEVREVGRHRPGWAVLSALAGLVCLFGLSLPQPLHAQQGPENAPPVENETEMPEEGAPAEAEAETEQDGEEADGEQADGRQADGDQADGETEELPGEVIETRTETTRKVSGRADEAHPDRVQRGLNAEGVPGFQGITSADAVKPNTYSVAFYGDFSKATDVIRAGDTNSFVAGRLAIHAQPIKYFSANLSLGARNNVNAFGRPEAMLSQGDLSLGLRGHHSPLEFFHFAGDVTIDVPTGFGSAGPDFAGTSVTPRILGTFDVDPLIEDADVPVTAHLNVGYELDNTPNLVPDGLEPTRVERYAYNLSAYDYIKTGIGVEYAAPFVTPFVAWNLSVPVAGPEGLCTNQSLPCVSEAGFGAFPNTLSFGLKAEPLEGFGLHGGVDVSLTTKDAAGIPVTAPYTVTLGLSWAVDPTGRVETVTKETIEVREVRKMPPQAYLVGTVVDSKSGEPIGNARIEYVDSSQSPQVTGSANGQFRSYGFETGSTVQLKVSHPEYATKTVEATLEGEGEQSKEIALAPATGVIRGVVTGPEGEPVSGATVKIAGPESMETTSGDDGSFSAKVKAGDYTVGVSQANYLAGGADVTVDTGGEASARVELGPAPDQRLATLDGDTIQLEERVVFESGSSTLKDESTAILDQVAAVLFANPSIKKVEVQGHTDSSGERSENMTLSQNRAETVKGYLTNKGIDPSRLVAKGYGPDQPLVPNITPQNRRLNRRVEFQVLERR
jgi:outer membrane protein OmpA-like peptidoglycan-associated protein